ncbi:hypothetical protein GCM10010124_01060 [Pilimelia terevasa]|uniref:Glycosyltransferase n=1 Tax=Pilimelia terevasa TaxID=53372 RepID=A0A8J3BJ26_9ACTN|nr:glycosyltransferase [Pilimelia terevasa]GGK12338.1 hypothetical protein GCM10010124_01060 [Pilimelia terevasa]
MAAEPRRQVAVLTPWYPNLRQPHAGTFVRSMVHAVAAGCDDIEVHHFDSWSANLDAAGERAALRAQRALGARMPRWAGTDDEGVRFGYHPVPVSSRPTRAHLTAQHAAVLGGLRITAPVVHAHVGTPTAWAALQHLPAGARLFVTEHMSFLADLLADADNRRMYGEVLDGCTGLFAVGRVLRDQLVAAFPQHADKIVVVPNPVDFGPPRAAPVRAPLRWIYVGSFVARKAVHLLVEALAVCRAQDPRLTLTLVGGSGEGEAELRELARRRGVADAVTFVGPVPHAEAVRLMRTHDLLLHASRWETFGMTPAEAVGAGTPVVVTRCGGPEETLADVIDLAGELVEVTDTPDALVAGYRRLRDRFDTGLDLPEARRRLVDRFGPAAVAAHHHHHWFGDPAPAGRRPVVPPQRGARQAGVRA